MKLNAFFKHGEVTVSLRSLSVKEVLSNPKSKSFRIVVKTSSFESFNDFWYFDNALQSFSRIVDSYIDSNYSMVRDLGIHKRL